MSKPKSLDTIGIVVDLVAQEKEVITFEKQDLLFHFHQVNEWLNDIKAKTTAWVIMPSLYKLLNNGEGVK